MSVRAGLRRGSPGKWSAELGRICQRQAPSSSHPISAGRPVQYDHCLKAQPPPYADAGLYTTQLVTQCLHYEVLYSHEILICHKVLLNSL